MNNYLWSCQVKLSGGECRLRTERDLVCKAHRKLAYDAGVRFARPGKRSTGRIWASRFRWLLGNQPDYISVVLVEEFGCGIRDQVLEQEKILAAARKVG